MDRRVQVCAATPKITGTGRIQGRRWGGKDDSSPMAIGAFQGPGNLNPPMAGSRPGPSGASSSLAIQTDTRFSICKMAHGTQYHSLYWCFYHCLATCQVTAITIPKVSRTTLTAETPERHDHRLPNVTKASKWTSMLLSDSQVAYRWHGFSDRPRIRIHRACNLAAQ